VALAVDEEARCPRDAAGVRAGDVVLHSLAVRASTELVPESLAVELQLRGIASEVPGRHRILVGEELVVHRPECVLRTGCVGSFRLHLSVRVHVGERQMAPDVAQVVAELPQQFADGDLGLAAVRTLVVAVFDQCDRGAFGAADVVARGLDVVG
jgi:hypothetical protein